MITSIPYTKGDVKVHSLGYKKAEEKGSCGTLGHGGKGTCLARSGAFPWWNERAEGEHEDGTGLSVHSIKPFL